MVAAFLLATLLAAAAPPAPDQIAAIEQRSGGRIGVAALESGSGREINFRPDERFRMCSNFKFLAAAAVLKKVDEGNEQLNRFVTYGQGDLLAYAPVTRVHVQEGGMKLADLCAAALQQSDNTAGNLLLRAIGGPAGLTKFLRSTGDSASRLDRGEPELNEGQPGDERDTTTPAAMRANLARLLTGDLLSPASRSQLETWMAGNTTGKGLIRGGVPAGWKVGDKTGRSGGGAVNDIAILHPPGRPPILLAIYTVGPPGSGPAQNQIVAGVARVVADSFSPGR